MITCTNEQLQRAAAYVLGVHIGYAPLMTNKSPDILHIIDLMMDAPTEFVLAAFEFIVRAEDEDDFI